MNQELVQNTRGLKVLTPVGLKNFGGMSKTWHERVIVIKTASRKIVCGAKHAFLAEPGWLEAEKLVPGASLTTADFKDDPILAVKVEHEPQWLYDLLDVEGGSAYISNGVISHNCEFLSTDALLIDSLKLNHLTPKPPVNENMGFKFWTDKIGGYGKLYLVGVAPATGNGNDFTAIEVFEFPSLDQVAELRLNTVSVPLIYSKLKWLLAHLRQRGPDGKRAEVAWSFERNGVGEALVAMIQNDDDPRGGIYLDGVELYNEAQNRLGVYTTGKSKLVACMQLKSLIEKVKGGANIKSEALLFELKNYVAQAGTYDHRAGATGDLVSACLIVMKLLNRLAEFDDKARKLVYEAVPPDADQVVDDFGDAPVPFAIV